MRWLLPAVAGAQRRLRPSSDRAARLITAGIALCLFAMAVGVRFALDRAGVQTTFVAFLPAVVAAALLCGRWPTVALIVVSTLAANDWDLPRSLETVVACLLFAGAAAAAAAPALRLRAAEQELVQCREAAAIRERDLRHRLKNLFAVTNSVCQQTIRAGGQLSVLSATLEGRIQAIAQAEDVLASGDGIGCDLRALVEALVRPIAPAPGRFSADGDALTLPGDLTTSLALVLHELASNAERHGAWTGSEGTVSLHWRLEAAGLAIEWRERGGPEIAGSQVRERLGTRLIKRALPRADVALAYEPTGLRCVLSLPL